MLCCNPRFTVDILQSKICGGCESNRRGQNKFKHSSVRNVIERSFGVLKIKWQILYKMFGYSIVTQKKIVAATMGLHNFIREHASVDVDFANFDRDPTYMPTIPESYNKYAVTQHASDG